MKYSHIKITLKQEIIKLNCFVIVLRKIAQIICLFSIRTVDLIFLLLYSNKKNVFGKLLQIYSDKTFTDNCKIKVKKQNYI